MSALCDCWAAGKCSVSCPPPTPLAAEQDQAINHHPKPILTLSEHFLICQAENADCC